MEEEGGFTVRRLKVLFSNRTELARFYLSESPHGGIIAEVDESVRPGEILEMCILCQEENAEETIKGVVLWQRREGVRHLAGIGFLATEVEKRERLLGHHAPQEEFFPQRTSPRYHTALRVTYRNSADFVVDYTRNISTGGVFIASGNPPPAGEQILLRLYPPGESEPIDLPAKVAWRRPGSGFRVRFLNHEGPARQRLEKLVRSIAIEAPVKLGSPIFEEVTPV